MHLSRLTTATREDDEPGRHSLHRPHHQCGAFVAVGCGDVKLREGGCLADIAPTMLPYIGLPVPAEMTGKSIIVE